MNAHPDKAKAYASLKYSLAKQFVSDRGSYTAGKQTLIDELLKEASCWRREFDNVDD